ARLTSSCAPSRAWAISARTACAIRSRRMARRWIPPSAWRRATADVLYVVAWPLMGEGDELAIRRLRAQYHPREADLIGPHFTLVFGAPVDHEAALRDALAAIDRRPFWFLIYRIVRHDLYLYAEPSDGAAE